MDILNIDLHNINLDNTNYDEEDPDNIILIRLLDCHIKFEKHETLKKYLNEELIPIAWHHNRWCDFWVSEDEKKNRSNVYWRVLKVCVGSIQYGGIQTFCWRVRR